ncbi:MAG: MarR family winged helix-turn-helix transcriptional regulator [Microbacteriaceae bacterium]|nr:MarR family winged helix-turn-helix transcriptional regulator [Microbacteriaceae bacterium]MCL2795721.1 MarR family winged helix-turn-helix transcriptional regulator [Microbacteriaceae bacterium]
MDAPIEFFNQLVRTEILLFDRMDERMKANHGVTVGTVNVLSLLAGIEHPRVDDLVRALDLRVGTASKIVDRYVEAGWIERVANPHDRRSSWLVVTAAGRELLEAARPAFEVGVRDLAAGLSTAEQATLQKLLGKLAASIEGAQPS